MKTEKQYAELARTIYRDLREGIGNAVDWRLSDKYDIAVSEIDEIVKASKGHLRDRNGIVEVAR